MQLIGSNPAAQPVGLDLQAGQSNYFVGNNPSQWITNIANYGQVEYQQVYQGVSLDYHGTQGQLEFDFTVGRGPTPARSGSSSRRPHRSRSTPRGTWSSSDPTAT